MSPSPTSAIGLILLVGILAAAFVRVAGRASTHVAVSAGRTRQERLIATSLVLLWLVPAAVLAGAGLLADFDRRPPPLLLLVATTVLSTTIVAFSPFGQRFAMRAGVAGLVGFQVFRLPLELLLHRLYREGVLPVQMTFDGANYDILSGVSAVVLGWWLGRGRPPGVVVWLWNIAAFALLLTIMTIAVMSIPGPLRMYANEPANTVVATFPFVWLPAFLVQAAWFGHLLVFRLLIAPRRS